MSLCGKIFARNNNPLQPTKDGFDTSHQPVHSSKSGTCVSINAAKDTWYCRSCKVGGGSIKAIISLEGKSFDEAEAEVLAMGGVPLKPAPRLASLHLNVHGKPKTAFTNVVKVLRHETRFADVLRYNAFTSMVELHAPPPPLDPQTPWTCQPLTSTLTSAIRDWMQDTYEVYAAANDVAEALVMCAHDQTYHPVVDYLQAVQWDGTPRLETWLTTYGRVEDTTYSRAVGTATLIGAVARIF